MSLADQNTQVASGATTLVPNVYVVDDDPMVRKTVLRLFDSVDLPCQEFPSASDFLERVAPDQPGCLLLDVRMPGIGGLELQEVLVQRGYGLPVIIVTGFADVSMAVQALKHGAHEFIEKPFNNDRLLDCVRRAIEKDSAQRRQADEVHSIEGRLASLSPRERQVLELVVVGSSNREIAEKLGVTPKTIEAHRAKVMSKMEAKSLAALVRMCVRANV